MLADPFALIFHWIYRIDDLARHTVNILQGVNKCTYSCLVKRTCWADQHISYISNFMYAEKWHQLWNSNKHDLNMKWEMYRVSIQTKSIFFGRPLYMFSKRMGSIPSYMALNPWDTMVSSDWRWSHIWLLILTIRSGTLDPVSLKHITWNSMVHCLLLTSEAQFIVFMLQKHWPVFSSKG